MNGIALFPGSALAGPNGSKIVSVVIDAGLVITAPANPANLAILVAKKSAEAIAESKQEAIQELEQEEKDVHQTSLPPILPAQDYAAQALTDITSAYGNFLSVDPTEVTDSQVRSFVKSVGRNTLKHTQHLPVLKSYFTNETRASYKSLFAELIYIVDPNHEDALSYLQSLNITSQEFSDLNEIRNDLKNSNIYTGGNAFGCVASSSNSSTRLSLNDPFESMTQRFRNRGE